MDGKVVELPLEMLTEVQNVLLERMDPLTMERLLRELRGTLLYRESLVFGELVEGLYRLL